MFLTIIFENQLTLAKAYKLLELAIKQKEITKQGLLDPKMTWNQGAEMSKDLAGGLADFLEKDIDWLKALMKQFPTLPKCKHPKKMRDRTPDGQWYCMNCNLDL